MIQNELKLLPAEDSYRILIYGEIGEGAEVTSEGFMEILSQAEAAGKPLEVHINSIGGDVYHGMAIYNALLNTASQVALYVDGVAASIAGVIALCGKPLYMNRYSKLMLHSASTVVAGNSTDLMRMSETLAGIEDDLAGMIASRMGKSPEEVKMLYFDGHDHWLSASEAQGLGLIDGIINEGVDPLTDNPKEIYMKLQSSFERNRTNTLVKRLKALPTFINLADENAIVNHIQELEQKAKLYDEAASKSTPVEKALANLKEAHALKPSEETVITKLASSNPTDFLVFARNRLNEIRKDNAERFEEIVKRNHLRHRFGASFTDTAIRKMALDNMEAFDRMAGKLGSWRAVDVYQSYQSIEDKGKWTLDDYRKKAPNELRDNPILYDQLVKEDQELKRGKTTAK